jgi:hypothetical protein
MLPVQRVSAFRNNFVVTVLIAFTVTKSSYMHFPPSIMLVHNYQTHPNHNAFMGSCRKGNFITLQDYSGRAQLLVPIRRKTIARNP